MTIAAGESAISDVPASRWDSGALFSVDPDQPGKTYSRHGGFVHDPDRPAHRGAGVLLEGLWGRCDDPIDRSDEIRRRDLHVPKGRPVVKSGLDVEGPGHPVGRHLGRAGREVGAEHRTALGGGTAVVRIEGPLHAALPVGLAEPGGGIDRAGWVPLEHPDAEGSAS